MVCEKVGWISELHNKITALNNRSRDNCAFHLSEFLPLDRPFFQ